MLVECCGVVHVGAVRVVVYNMSCVLVVYCMLWWFCGGAGSGDEGSAAKNANNQVDIKSN